jgi:hypothetical protein
MEVVVVKQRRHLEAFWEGVKKKRKQTGDYIP